MTKILLIEDDDTMRENTAEILALARYEVKTAPNGKIGAALAKEIRPDLVVCDIMMPELDGYGVLHVLSKDPETAAIPFIFLTAKAEKSEMRRGMELGADDYLTKPFEETELLSAVETRLKKTERIRQEFAQTLAGLDGFMTAAKGIKELENLSQARPVVRYKKKEVLFREGDVPQHLIFLVVGKLKTFKSHDDGKEYVTCVYGPGEFLGYAPLLENNPYTDSAAALEDCQVVKIPKEDFLALIYKNRDVAARFIRLLSGNVAEREKQLLSLAYDSVRKRVAATLLTLAKRYAVPGRKNTRIPISREDLAGMAGTVMETVIRNLSEFKSERFIEVDGREIVLLNPEGLRQIS